MIPNQKPKNYAHISKHPSKRKTTSFPLQFGNLVSFFAANVDIPTVTNYPHLQGNSPCSSSCCIIICFEGCIFNMAKNCVLSYVSVYHELHLLNTNENPTRSCYLEYLLSFFLDFKYVQLKSWTVAMLDYGSSKTNYMT